MPFGRKKSKTQKEFKQYDRNHYNQFSLAFTEVEIMMKKCSGRGYMRKKERLQLIDSLESATKVMQRDEKDGRTFIQSIYTNGIELVRMTEDLLDSCLASHDLELVTVGCNFLYHTFKKRYLEDYKLNIDLSGSISGIPRVNFSGDHI